VVGDPPAAAILASPRSHPYAERIAEVSDTGHVIGGMVESERLARRYFAVFARGETDLLIELIHPDVEILLKTVRRGEVIRGREAMRDYVSELGDIFFESQADLFRPLDDTRVVVEGRVRWMDDDRILRDDPMIWALEFRDGLLYRSRPAQSVFEAETLLTMPQR
jgi:ketosteroid isomerase-like protein